jgi:hypothetical protein
MTGEVLRILLLALSSASWRSPDPHRIFALLRDLRAEVTQMAASRDRQAVGGRVSDEARWHDDRVRPINSMGRNVRSTIFIDDGFVSGTHAMLTFRGRAVHRGPGSTNGTYVNGHRTIAVALSSATS